MYTIVETMNDILPNLVLQSKSHTQTKNDMSPNLILFMKHVWPSLITKFCKMPAAKHYQTSHNWLIPQPPPID